MATTKKVLEIEIDVDSGDVKKLDADLNKITGKTKELNNQQEAQNETTNNAIGLIDKYTGGLASSATAWFKMGKSASKALTGIKSGLVSTGIGALVVGLGLVVAYWDEIVDFIGAGDDEMQNLIDSQEAYNKELERTEDLNKKVSAALKRQGASELDQLKTKISQQKESREIADKAAREALEAFNKIKKQRELEQKRYTGGINDLFGVGATEEELKEAEEIFDKASKAYDEYNESVKDLIFQRQQLEKKLEEEVTEKTEAEQNKRIDLTQKYLDLKLSLEQAHSLSLIEDDRERQLKALEFELENNRKSIEQSEFTEKQKRALKESYEIQWLDKKTQLEDEWRVADQLKIDEAEKLKQDRLDAALKAQGDSEIQAEQEYRNRLSELQDEAFEKTLSDQDWEIRMAQEKYNTLIEQAELYGEDKAAIEAMQAAEENEIKARYAEEAAAKKKANEQAAADATVAVATATIGSLSALNQAFSKDDEKGRREAFKREKALGIASAVINTAKSAVSAYNSMAGIPFVGPVLAPIAAVAAIAAGAAQIKNITKQKYKGESGGGGGGGASGLTASGGGSAPSAPQFNTVGTSGFNQINESLNNNNRNPTKAYVVSGEVSSAQSLDRNRIKEATFP
jgi:hypothetical protein